MERCKKEDLPQTRRQIPNYPRRGKQDQIIITEHSSAQKDRKIEFFQFYSWAKKWLCSHQAKAPTSEPSAAVKKKKFLLRPKFSFQELYLLLIRIGNLLLLEIDFISIYQVTKLGIWQQLDLNHDLLQVHLLSVLMTAIITQRLSMILQHGERCQRHGQSEFQKQMKLQFLNKIRSLNISLPTQQLRKFLVHRLVNGPSINQQSRWSS